MALTKVPSGLIEDGTIIDVDINASAAIAKSKLASLDIVNADINASAAIAKTKLAALNIINADINASAAIAQSKLATLSITDANIANDAISGDKISGGTIEAALTGSVTGSLSGNANTSTVATNVAVIANNTTDETVYPTFVDGATGTQGLETDTALSYNPSTGLLSTNHVVCSGTGVLVVPVGTTAQRPGLAPMGGIRFNSTTTRFEGYNGSAWVNIDTLYS